MANTLTKRMKYVSCQRTMEKLHSLFWGEKKMASNGKQSRSCKQSLKDHFMFLSCVDVGIDNVKPITLLERIFPSFFLELGHNLGR